MFSAFLYLWVYLIVALQTGEPEWTTQMLVDTVPYWGVMFWLPEQTILALNNGKSVPGQLPLSMAIGIAICLVADRLLRIQRRDTANKG